MERSFSLRCSHLLQKKKSLDLDMFEKNLAAQVAAGIHGIIIGGSLGEASTITEKEKEELLNSQLNILMKIFL
jgi:dihydrodipicolinate synthase/N-acetylneuraminate lyase